MCADVRDDRRYLESHEWAMETDGTVRIGITDFAQDELGDIVYVELPEEGDELRAGEPFGVIESIKAVSDLYAPIGGTVTASNADLLDYPERVNEDPFGEGWMLEIDPADSAELDDLLDPDEYADQLA